MSFASLGQPNGHYPLASGHRHEARRSVVRFGRSPATSVAHTRKWPSDRAGIELPPTNALKHSHLIINSRIKAFKGKAFHAAIKFNAMINIIVIKFIESSLIFRRVAAG
ncbi:hypothetical protein [Burkholderia sp. L27(2015)]|uniref:hypothetical protein n=1 Tax=Burkholderia sp. L27(2015) TaxID=1641858 RepID=UPI00131D289D|nr:hypothetical protein [Burkholderia sp. L27(2015)]